MRKVIGLNQRYINIIGVVYVYTSFNNTLITVTNIQGKPLVFLASGCLGLKGAKRSTPYAGQSLAEILAKKLGSCGIRFIYIQLRGFGSGRKSVLKGFCSSNLKIVAIKDKTGIPHNGCKLRKKRRV